MYCPQPKDCSEILALGYTQSGLYTVYVGPYKEPVGVYCDQETDGGGWLVGVPFVHKLCVYLSRLQPRSYYTT